MIIHTFSQVCVVAKIISAKIVLNLQLDIILEFYLILLKRQRLHWRSDKMHVLKLLLNLCDIVRIGDL